MTEISKLWHNSFSETIDIDSSITNKVEQALALANVGQVTLDNTSEVIESVSEGNKVRTFAHALEIPININTNNNFYSLDNVAGQIQYDNIKFNIIGPTSENLVELRNAWDEWLENSINDMGNGQFNVTKLSDKSVPNLSSITFVLTDDDGKKILFTGDARADHIMEGLKKKRLLKSGRLHVDILKVPHHGSDRNTDREFFEKITADTYVISADGKHGNPDLATLTWIVESAHDQEREILLFTTYETESTKELKRKYPPAQYGYQLEHISVGNSHLFSL